MANREGKWITVRGRHLFISGIKEESFNKTRMSREGYTIKEARKYEKMMAKKPKRR